MIGKNIARTEAAAAVDQIIVDTLQHSYIYAGNDVADYHFVCVNDISIKDKIEKLEIMTMDGLVHTYYGNFSVEIIRNV